MSLALGALAGEGASTVEVSGTYTCEALGRLPVDVAVEAYRMPGLQRVRQSSWSSGHFSLKLPPGEYLLFFHGSEIAQARLSLQVPEGEARLVLDPVALEPGVLTSCYGKPLPEWRASSARGIAPDTSPADFKGRWLVLAFWGFW